MSFELIATTASPRGWYSRASAANPARRWRTNGQWLQMKATSSAGAAPQSASAWRRPSQSGSAKSGAGVPSGSIVEGVRAMSLPSFSGA